MEYNNQSIGFQIIRIENILSLPDDLVERVRQLSYRIELFEEFYPNSPDISVLKIMLELARRNGLR